METKMKIVIVAVVTLAAMAIIGYFLINSVIDAAGPRAPGELDGLAACLTEKGYKMAGTEWCSACKKQKQIFGASFALVNYKNCDIEKDFCFENQVDRYPTWVGPDGTKTIGVMTPEMLAELAGCEV